jgi:hypothetical protein
VKATSESEFDSLRNILQPIFNEYSQDLQKGELLEKKLNKIGLTFAQRNIEIKEEIK